MPELAILLAAIAAVTLGSVVQAASGVGAGFLMVPMLAWLDLSLVPGPMIFGSLALSGIMTWQERGEIDGRNLPTIILWLVPGCVAGGWILSSVPPQRLSLVFGVGILLALSATISGLRVQLNPRTAAVAALVSGATGASTGIGAPILAILYQHEPGARVRSTLALLYTIASSMIIVILAAFGEFGLAEAASGAALMPGFLLGYVIANRFRHRLDRGGSRPAVLIASAFAAVTLILRGLLA